MRMREDAVRCRLAHDHYRLGILIGPLAVTGHGEAMRALITQACKRFGTGVFDHICQ